MTDLPRRTHCTFLSDDDLLIFDFLTLGNVPVSSIRKADYAFHMNCDYTHSLSDAELVERVHDLVQLRLMNYRLTKCRRVKRGQLPPGGQSPCQFPFPRAVLSFNLDGGELWEQERDIDWERWIWWMPSPQVTITVASLSQRIVQDFMNVSQNTGRYFLTRPPKVTHYERLELGVIYTTRIFDNVFTATAARREYPDHKTLARCWDRVAYGEQRTWWFAVNKPPSR